VRRLSAIAAMLVAAVSLVACTADARRSGSSAAAPPKPCPSDKACHAVIGTDPAIAVYQGEFYSTLMPLTARLEWVESESCLVVTRHGDHYRQFRTLVPLWPEGTKPVRAPDGRRGIEIPQVGQIFEGAFFTAGGTDYPPNLKPPIPRISTLTQPPGACTAHDGFFVIEPSAIRRLES
jgi:hypothetical protein